ncbi:hypothetical protein V9T40_006545 [Parthenolecanium corni]|uniref:RRM domain-containing protein n=1 Tax=Parthenolecanium corni TaxID=536013 RepID=A0AAN9Y6R6_9HEMI
MTGQTDPLASMIMATKVIQVTNIAPQATRDQMQTLFGFVGKVEEIRLYPTMRDVSLPVQSRICYVKYFDPACVGVAQHLTNTVFIDRALIVTPYQAKGGEIPDEYRALDIAAQASVIPGLYSSDPKLPAHIINQIEGVPPNQVISTHDPVLASSGLPPYPPLPITYDSRRIEEIRRTLLVVNVDDSISGEQLVDFFQRAGDVKYVRFCTRDNDSNRYALVEFAEQSSIIAGLKLNGSELAGKRIQVYHSTQAIAKPTAKSNETAQREIEEAMTRVKEAQSMISAAIDPVIGILSKDKKRSRSSSRSRRHSRSRSRRRSRSRSKHRRRSSRSRSRSRRSKRRSRSRHSSRRSRSRDRRRRRSRDRKRSRGHSRSHKRRSDERRRSASRSKKSRSKSKSRRRGSRSPSDRSSRSKSRRPPKEDEKRASSEKRSSEKQSPEKRSPSKSSD